MVQEIGVFVRTAVTMVEKDDNMKLASNNQFMKGIINNEKNIITKIKSYLSEHALYFWYFYKNLTIASKHLVSELEETEVWSKNHKSKSEKKGRENTGG